MLSNYLAIDGAIGVKTRVDSAIEKDLQRLSQMIDDKQRSAEDYLERLWREFTAMETRIAQINSQSQYLAQLGGGGGQAAA
jgi:flagellar capping protein FliD